MFCRFFEARWGQYTWPVSFVVFVRHVCRMRILRRMKEALMVEKANLLYW